jgi:hypothetical protein
MFKKEMSTVYAVDNKIILKYINYIFKHMLMIFILVVLILV